jgi:hypothetical protein
MYDICGQLPQILRFHLLHTGKLTPSRPIRVYTQYNRRGTAFGPMGKSVYDDTVYLSQRPVSLTDFEIARDFLQPL